jgi:hypothetical protein
MRCPPLEEVVERLRGRTLSFEALAYRCGREEALRLVAAAVLQILLDGARGVVVCVGARPLWACNGARSTLCLPKAAAVRALVLARRTAEEAGIRPLWSSPLKKAKKVCWLEADARKLLKALLNGGRRTSGRARRRADFSRRSGSRIE